MKEPRPYVQRDRARAAAATGERILDSTVALFLEAPYAQLTLAAVAARAGVTVQTVIRRFGDKQGLVAAAATRTAAQVQVQRDLAPVGDVVAAVRNLVAHYELQADVALRLLAEEEASHSIAAVTRAGRALHWQWCDRVFEPTLAGLSGAERDRRLAQLAAVCDVYTWKILRRDAGLDVAQTTRSLVEMLEPLTA